MTRITTQTRALLLFGKSYDTIDYVTWVLRVLNSTRRGSHTQRGPGGVAQLARAAHDPSRTLPL
jgi:hypothetical protein